MKKNSFFSYFLIISVMTFITLFVVVVSKSYDNLIKSINIAQSNPLGKSIDMDLKTDVINIIEARQKIETSINP